MNKYLLTFIFILISNVLFADTFVGFDGSPLYYKAYEVENPKGKLIFLHDINEYSAYYEKSIEYFNENALSVYVMDIRGHGNSRNFSDNYVYTKTSLITNALQYVDFSYLVNDLAILIDKLSLNNNLFLCGIGLGANIVSAYAIKYPSKVSKLVLISPLTGINLGDTPLTLNLIRKTMTFLIKIKNKGLPFNQIKVPMTAIDGNMLSKKSDFIDKYDNDPLIFHEDLPLVLINIMYESILYMNDNVFSLKVPTLILIGHDDIVPYQSVKSYYNKLATLDKKMIKYDNSKHNLLNDTETERVLKDIIYWLFGEN